jgi:hypothetical protein
VVLFPFDQQLLQAFLTKQVLMAVFRFDNAIGIEQQDVARLKLGTFLLKVISLWTPKISPSASSASICC